MLFWRTGQGTTTREFAELGGQLYSTGGNGNTTLTVNKVQNTGNGGSKREYGSSGIVVIRNAR